MEPKHQEIGSSKPPWPWAHSGKALIERGWMGHWCWYTFKMSDQLEYFRRVFLSLDTWHFEKTPWILADVKIKDSTSDHLLPLCASASVCKQMCWRYFLALSAGDNVQLSAAAWGPCYSAEEVARIETMETHLPPSFALELDLSLWCAWSGRTLEDLLKLMCG